MGHHLYTHVQCRGAGCAHPFGTQPSGTLDRQKRNESGMDIDVVRPALTDRQAQALKYITDCLSDRGYPPTLREIGEHMGIKSTNGVNDHLKALERKGYLQREELKSRALRPIDVFDAANSRPDRDEVEVPILGSVAAGAPILAEEN